MTKQVPPAPGSEQVVPSIRVTRVRIDGVGPFTNFELKVRPGRDATKADILLLAGPNGSGKSTILYAIAGCFELCAELATRFRDSRGVVQVDVEVLQHDVSQSHSISAWKGRDRPV